MDIGWRPPRPMAFVVSVLLAVALAGCISSNGPTDSGRGAVADPFAFAVDELGFVDRGFSGIEHLGVDFPSPLGGTIHAEVYLPADLGSADQIPVILEVSPYNPQKLRDVESPAADTLRARPMIDRYVERGYGLVFADARGFGGSSGCWDYHGDGELADTVAAVEWASAQPWSTGEVGMVGFSYSGATAVQAAVSQAEGLRTVFLLAPETSVYENHWMNGVAYRWDYPLASATHFSAIYSASTAIPAWYDVESHPGYVSDVAERPECMAETTTSLNDLDGRYTDYFVQRERQDNGTAIDASVFWVHGFWDQNVKSALLTPMWQSLDAPKRAWFWHGYHEAPDEETSGRNDLFDQQHRWFDYWLYGFDNGIMDEPSVEVQDSLGRWRHEGVWPPKDAEPLRLVPMVGGSLAINATSPGVASFTTDRYTSFSSACYDTGLEGCSPVARVPAGAHFTAASTPLEEPVHVSGMPKFTLRLSSDDPRGQIVVGLFDVDPDGTWTLVNEATMGLRHRDGLDRVVDVVPGETMDLAFEGWPTDWVFEKGHRVATVYVGAEFRFVTPDAKHTLTLELGQGTATELPVVPWRDETFAQTASTALENRERMGPPEGF